MVKPKATKPLKTRINVKRSLPYSTLHRIKNQVCSPAIDNQIDILAIPGIPVVCQNKDEYNVPQTLPIGGTKNAAKAKYCKDYAQRTESDGDNSKPRKDGKQEEKTDEDDYIRHLKIVMRDAVFFIIKVLSNPTHHTHHTPIHYSHYCPLAL